MTRRSLVFVLGLVSALAFGVAPAWAQTAHWDPPNVEATAVADDSMLEYDGGDDGDVDATVSCETSTAVADTSDDGTGGNTPFGDLLDLTFGTEPGFDDCTAAPAGDVEDIEVNGLPWVDSLIAVSVISGDPGDGEVDISIPNIPGTDVAALVETSSVFLPANCLIEVLDNQTPGTGDQDSTWDDDTQTLRVDVSGLQTRVTSTGGAGCLLATPGMGTSRFSGNYDATSTDPPNTLITIQPWP